MSWTDDRLDFAAETARRFDSFETRVDERFDKIDARFEEGFDRLQGRIDHLAGIVLQFGVIEMLTMVFGFAGLILAHI